MALASARCSFLHFNLLLLTKSISFKFLKPESFYSHYFVSKFYSFNFIIRVNMGKITNDRQISNYGKSMLVDIPKWLNFVVPEALCDLLVSFRSEVPEEPRQSCTAVDIPLLCQLASHRISASSRSIQVRDVWKAGLQILPQLMPRTNSFLHWLLQKFLIWLEHILSHSVIT